MERQLALLEAPIDWRLDARTREVGRQGVEQAREALRRALDDSDQHQSAA